MFLWGNDSIFAYQETFLGLSCWMLMEPITILATKKIPFRRKRKDRPWSISMLHKKNTYCLLSDKVTYAKLSPSATTLLTKDFNIWHLTSKTRGHHYYHHYVPMQPNGWFGSSLGLALKMFKMLRVCNFFRYSLSFVVIIHHSSGDIAKKKYKSVEFLRLLDL